MAVTEQNLVTIRKGLEANRLAYIPAEAEPVFSTDTKKLFIGDGVTGGGIPVLGAVFDDTTPKLRANLNMNDFSLEDGFGNPSFLASSDISTGGGYLRMGLNTGVRLMMYPSSVSGQSVFLGNIGTSVNKYLEINPTINDTGTNGWTGLSLNVTETAARTGSKDLINLQLGGVSKFKVDSSGAIINSTNIVSGGSIHGSSLVSLSNIFIGDSTNSGTIWLKSNTGYTYKSIQSGVGNVSFLNPNAAGQFNFDNTVVITDSVEATSFIKTSGTSSQFLKADGSVDSSTYLTSATETTYTAGVGLTLTGTVFSHTDTSSVATVSGLSGANVISALGFDAFGHVSSVGTRALTPADIGAEASANKGVANGYCPLDANTLIGSQYLPAYVDDVLEYANLAAFPASGVTGKIYVALDTNKTYRWSGSTYVLITSGAVDLVFGRAGLVVAVSGDYNAAQITNSPYGNLAAVNVQDAINELEVEKLALAGGTMNGMLTLVVTPPTNNQHATTKLYVDTHAIDGGTF